MLKRTKSWGLVAGMAVMAVSAACDRNPSGSVVDPEQPVLAALDTTFSSNPNRRFLQVERLANPLAMEVFVQKREHDAHDAFSPRQDPGHFTDDYIDFLTRVAGRNEAYARAVASVFLGNFNNHPGDMIKVFTTRAPGVTAANSATAGNVGFLTYVLNPTGGYGGRKLMGDDVVDKIANAGFGNLLGGPVTAPGLVTDNVDANDKPALTTFPYFPAPTNP